MGLAQAVNVARAAEAQSAYPGKTTGGVYYVGSTVTGASNSNFGLSPTSPFATLAYAAANVAADSTIYVMSNHAETIAAAAGIACSIAGVTVIGLGNGSARPTFSWSATDSTWTITAANVTLRNIVCVPSVNECVSMFSLSAAGCTFDGVDHISAATAIETIQFLLTTSAANNLTIKNCRHLQATAAASAQAWIQLVAGANAMIVDNVFDILANASASSFCIRVSTAATNVLIARNLICWRGASIVSPISLVTTTTGFISDNRIGMTSTSGTIDNIITGDTAFKFNNLVMDVAGTASGLLVPAVGTLT